MSGTIVSSFPNQNILYDMATGQTGLTLQHNQLLNQQEEQTIGAGETEMAARMAGTLLSAYQTPEARAAAYPSMLAQARANGYRLPHAPNTYPGDDAAQALARMGTPSADLFRLGIDRQAKGAIAPGDDGGTVAGTGGGAPASSAPATTVTPSGGATIGQRQNNPGNLTFAGQPGASPGQGNRFASFPDMPTGVAANADQLALYQTQHGINTVRGAVTRWVGDPKADLTSYIGDVAKAIGVGPDDKIDLTNPDVQAKFIQAQFPHESAGGGFVLNPADVQKGVQMAAANRGRSVQATGTAIATPAVAPGGVAARVGGTDVAGPGAGPGGAPGGDLVGPRVLPPIGPGSPVVTPQSLANTPTPQPQAQVPQPPPNRVMPGGPDGPPVQQPPAPVATAPQPPAADTLPPLPAPTPPAPTNRNGLTPAQQQDINNRRSLPNVSADELQKRVDSYVATNAAAAEKYQQDSIAYMKELRERQATAGTAEQRRIENQRQAHAAELADRAAARADAEAAQKAEAAGRPYQGSGIEAQDSNILLGGDDGSARYAGAYSRQAAPRVNVDGSTVIPNMTAYDKPTYRGGKGQAADGAPDYGTVKTTFPTQMNATQSLAAGFADRMRSALPVISDTSDAAMNRWQVLRGKAPVIGNSLVSAEFQQHMQAERDFINAVLRRESGAAISEPEFVNARQQYIPQPGDEPPVLAQKQRNRETVLANLVRDAGPAYKPPATTAAEQQPVSVKTPDEAQSLPPGTVYKTPDGRTFKR